MSIVTETWRRGTSITSGWDFTVKHRAVAMAYTYLAFGSDYRRWYADLADVRNQIEGAALLDVPCGGGVVFGHLSGTSLARYVGADVSPSMLALASKEAEKTAIRNLEMVECDVVTMPYDAEFDLCLSYMGLHCMPDPAGAIAAMARAVRPGGVVRGSTVIVGTGWRNDRFVSLWQRRGIFADVYSENDLRRWLDTAGLDAITVERSGAIAYFSATKPARV
ncbi:class I SAM-dependent methyltransferase [Rhodococcus erythropolis]|uniref:Class I SAM-dependent methyltransferase n=1 Tax=Rhodococcus erythropolis TaxID=1833 RepID=A0AAX4A089_RHOER|nr:class I SAM-dependent methyltransferase [Rhodococcus erythropolis]WMN02132.1 class I SAM-dependent methyltransferase [Rhodococcus erythropolis]WMN03107.1 class I SAM-dependent methyltransferase [Rhodococcus erythropolis]